MSFHLSIKMKVSNYALGHFTSRLVKKTNKKNNLEI